MLFTFDEAVFGKNDIRGIYGEGVTQELFTYVGKAYAKYISLKGTQDKDKNGIWVSLARDARNHSPGLAKALIDGLTSSGVNVIDLGLCPTPLAYYSEVAKIPNPSTTARKKEIELAGTLIVTASHNPSEYNGLKMTYKGCSLSQENIAELKNITKEIIENESGESAEFGFAKKYNIIPDYIATMMNSFAKVTSKIKIVVDSGNATAGVVAPDLYRELGCEVIDICTEPDGNFPNHHPNPSDRKTLQMLIDKVISNCADFGIAFDGDSDRVGIVDNKGNIIPGDQLLLIFSLDILNELKSRNEKPVFISEVKCSQVLYDQINQNGGNAIMWKTGHGFIKSKMREENAVFAGEMSGHIFFRDRYYGYDDAIYSGCRFIEIVAKNKAKNPRFKVSELMDNLPKSAASKEVRYPCPDKLKVKVIKDLKAKLDKNPDMFGSKIKEIITIDGLRVVFEDGFALIRASNTEPVFTIGFEAGSEANLKNYHDTLMNNVEESMNRLRSGSVK